jgi:hypothetical protein
MTKARKKDADKKNFMQEKNKSLLLRVGWKIFSIQQEILDEFCGDDLYNLLL